MAASVVDTIKRQIQDFTDVNVIKACLNQLPIGQVSNDNAERLITAFLQVAVQANNREATRMIVEEFGQMRSHIDYLPPVTNLFLNSYLTRDMVKFVVESFPDIEPIQYYVDLVNFPDDLTAIKLVADFATLLPELTNEEWKLLYQMTEDVEEEEYPNQMLRAYFQSKVAETGDCVSRPEWVINVPVEDILPIPPDLPTVKEAVDLLLEDMKNRMIATDKSGESVDILHGPEIREMLIAQYSIATITEKIKMLETVKDMPSFDSTALFREHGPINTMYNIRSFHDPNHECIKYGGCTMFDCAEFEQMNIHGDDLDIMTIDEHVEELDWFRGSCDVCLKKMSSRYHCVRLPLQHGGWRGCYCSVECLRKHITNSHVEAMASQMEQQLLTIGIRNR